MSMHPSSAKGDSGQRPFNPLGIVVVVLAILAGLSLWSRWYAEAVSTPRYCEDTEQTMKTLAKILTQDRPAGDEPRLPYVVAAKLLFLLPRGSDEPVADYLVRVRTHLERICR